MAGMIHDYLVEFEIRVMVSSLQALYHRYEKRESMRNEETIKCISKSIYTDERTRQMK